MVQEVLAIYADCGGAGRHCTGWQQLWLQATPREHRHWGVTDLAWWLALKVSSKQQKNTARNGSKKLEEGVATSWNSLVDNRNEGIGYLQGRQTQVVWGLIGARTQAPSRGILWTLPKCIWTRSQGHAMTSWPGAKPHPWKQNQQKGAICERICPLICIWQ